MEVVKRSHEPCQVVPAHSQRGTNEWRPAESMVSVSRIILLQTSRPWRASGNASDPAFRGTVVVGKPELARLRKESDVNAQPLKGRLISKKNGIAEAMR